MSNQNDDSDVNSIFRRTAEEMYRYHIEEHQRALERANLDMMLYGSPPLITEVPDRLRGIPVQSIIVDPPEQWASFNNEITTAGGGGGGSGETYTALVRARGQDEYFRNVSRTAEFWSDFDNRHKKKSKKRRHLPDWW